MYFLLPLPIHSCRLDIYCFLGKAEKKLSKLFFEYGESYFGLGLLT